MMDRVATMMSEKRWSQRANYADRLVSLPQGFEFVDAHHHLWDLSRSGYAWLKEDRDMQRYLGPYDELCRNYLVDEFEADSRSVNLIKSVHIETQDPTDPVVETAWLQSVSDGHSKHLPNAIIGAANLCLPGLERVLTMHEQYPNFRGIRALIFRDPKFAYSDEFQRGLELLSRHNLLFDADCDWQHMPMFSTLAQRFPDLQFVLNHCGFPKHRTSLYFSSWRAAIKEFAKNENVVCKISGLGMTDPDWTLDSIRPWVETCLEFMGIDRCVFATNWPVDSLFSSYEEVVRSYHHIVQDFSADEREKLFRRNAERTYQI